VLPYATFVAPRHVQVGQARQMPQHLPIVPAHSSGSAAGRYSRRREGIVSDGLAGSSRRRRTARRLRQRQHARRKICVRQAPRRTPPRSAAEFVAHHAPCPVNSS